MTAGPFLFGRFQAAYALLKVLLWKFAVQSQRRKPSKRQASDLK